MKTLLLGPVVAATALAIAAPATAHHSFAMFDRNKTTVLAGVVTEFQFSNPHSWLEIDVPQAGGAKHWSLEMNNLVGLRRNGWRAKSLVPGDKVQVAMHPMRDGSAAGQLMTVTLASGKILYGNGGPPNAAGPGPTVN